MEKLKRTDERESYCLRGAAASTHVKSTGVDA